MDTETISAFRFRSVYDHVITKFSRMGRLIHFLTHGAPLTRFASGSLAKKTKIPWRTSRGLNWESKRKDRAD